MKHIFLLSASLIALNTFGQKPLTLEVTVPGSPEFIEHYNAPVKGIFVENSDEFVVTGNNDFTINGKTITKKEINNILRTNGKTKMKSALCWPNAETTWIYAPESAAAYLVKIGEKTVCDSITGLYDIGNMSPGSKKAVFSIGNDLYIADRNGSRRINTKQEKNVKYGQAVHRNEWGIEDGTFWSESGRLLAFYRMDESMVGFYPIVNITAREAEAEPIPYPMAGEASHQVQIGIYNTTDSSTIYLKTASPIDRFFTNIAWSPDDKHIMVAELNRQQNHMWLNMYDAENGELERTIFEEENAEWVEPCTPAVFINNQQFVWLSERDGFRHIYLYDTNKNKCTQLTRGNWCVTELYGCNRQTGEIFFQANKQDYLTRDIFKVNPKGKITQLSSGYGIHNARFSKSFNTFIDNFSSPETAILSTLRHTKDNSTADTLKHIRDTYEGYTLPEFRTIKLKSADGQFELTGRLILPSDFDSTKTYPVIDYMYGGPHSQLVDGSWLYGASTWKMYFAQQGYIIFTMDNRGTEYRGTEYEHCIHRRLGVCEMEDQMQGIKYLKSLPYVDSTRIGIHGWSYGGFMTISMMTEHNTEFKAGVAGGPVCDWRLYEVMYGERYMDTPQENPDGYLNSCVTGKIGQLKGRLLVIHGDIDPVVVWQNSLQLMQSAVDNNVLIDYAVYPQHEHNVIGIDRVHLFKRILQYFDDHLK